MECDIFARLVKLESTIQTLEAKIDDLTRKRTNSAIASEIEDEITDDIHCFFRFIRHFLCFLN